MHRWNSSGRLSDTRGSTRSATSAQSSLAKRSSRLGLPGRSTAVEGSRSSLLSILMGICASGCRRTGKRKHFSFTVLSLRHGLKTLITFRSSITLTAIRRIMPRLISNGRQYLEIPRTHLRAARSYCLNRSAKRITDLDLRNLRLYRCECCFLNVATPPKSQDALALVLKRPTTYVIANDGLMFCSIKHSLYDRSSPARRSSRSSTRRRRASTTRASRSTRRSRSCRPGPRR